MMLLLLLISIFFLEMLVQLFFLTASDLVNRLSRRLRLFFAPAFAESEAFSDVDIFQWPVGLFDRDCEFLSSLAVVEVMNVAFMSGFLMLLN